MRKEQHSLYINPKTLPKTIPKAILELSAGTLENLLPESNQQALPKMFTTTTSKNRSNKCKTNQQSYRKKEN